MSSRGAGHRNDCGSGRQRDRGSAGLLLLAVVGLAVCVAGTALLLAGAAIGQARASSAADLAALAAAERLAEGRARACAHAAAVARQNRARLVTCVITSENCSVIVEVPYSGALRRFGAVRAEARAGQEPIP